MWFKQIQVFKISNSSLIQEVEKLNDRFASFAFQPCLPTIATSQGWVSPVDDNNAVFAHKINSYLMICLQTEEKILPASVVRQALNEQVKQLETEYERKIGGKEKSRLKDDIIHTLLPQAFSKLIKTYAYIDCQNHWLVLNTTNTKQTEKFIKLLKRTLEDIEIKPIEINNLKPIMTRWLLDDSTPEGLTITHNCVLQDPSHEKRIIRCQQQDLFANALQLLLKDNCQVKQLGLNWQGQIDFSLTENLHLRNVRFEDSVTELTQENHTETASQQFDANFVIMTAAITPLLTQLISNFSHADQKISREEPESKLEYITA